MKISDETIKLIEQHRLPLYHEIPNVGLYLEQTAKYINEFLEPIMDTAITGSMISNYVKKKIVANPVKKMYYRDHIAQLIIIAIVKSVISLDKVKLIQQIDDTAINEEVYNNFIKTFDYALKKVFAADVPDAEPGADSDTDKILGDIVNTVAHKIYIDKLLSTL